MTYNVFSAASRLKVYHYREVQTDWKLSRWVQLAPDRAPWNLFNLVFVEVAGDITHFPRPLLWVLQESQP